MDQKVAQFNLERGEMKKVWIIYAISYVLVTRIIFSDEGKRSFLTQ